MHKVIIIFALVCAGLQVKAQDPVIQKFYRTYTELENVEDIQIKGWILKLAGRYVDEKGVASTLQKISKLRVMTIDDGNTVTNQAYNSLVRQVRNRQFEDLIQFKDRDSAIQVMIREKKNRITDVLMLINGDDSFTLLSLEGALKFSDLKSLNIDVEGGEHFKKIPARRKDIPQA